MGNEAIQDKTSLDESDEYYRCDQVVIDDWSRSGRGSHVDFDHNETVPLQPGRFLGRGAVGDVHEITLQGWKLAHKRILFRKKIGEDEKKEIEILKRLSHFHVVQLIGTYTQQKILGILMYPSAVCDLHTFFEDVEAWAATSERENSQVERHMKLEPAQRDRLKILNYDFPMYSTSGHASPVNNKIGCLVSAIAYLHEQKIRHKDIKPSNILLARDRLWLTDFGSATDFTLLSQSATDNERGTPRYFAPEMAKWKPSGRAADIFSLGCVLLEIVVLHMYGTLNYIRQSRSPDPSFHANLHNVDKWLNLTGMRGCRRGPILRWQIHDMLAEDPEKRPTANDVLAGIIACDLKRYATSPSLFSDCCRTAVVSGRVKNEQEIQIQSLQAELERANEKAARQEIAIRIAKVRSTKDLHDLNYFRSKLTRSDEEIDEARNALAKYLELNTRQENIITELEREVNRLKARDLGKDQRNTSRHVLYREENLPLATRRSPTRMSGDFSYREENLAQEMPRLRTPIQNVTPYRSPTLDSTSTSDSSDVPPTRPDLKKKKGAHPKSRRTASPNQKSAAAMDAERRRTGPFHEKSHPTASPTQNGSSAKIMDFFRRSGVDRKYPDPRLYPESEPEDRRPQGSLQRRPLGLPSPKVLSRMRDP